MDNGLLMVKEMAKELNYGKMEANMKAIGKMIKQMEKEDSFMPMAIYMREIGLMTKLKEEDYMSI